MLKTVLSIAYLAVGALAGCADVPNAYAPGASYSSAITHLAVIESVGVKPMKRPAPNAVQQVIGTGLAGVLGGVVGSNVGGGKGKQLAAAAGAAGGAAAGTAAMDRSSIVPGDELTYTLIGCEGKDCTFTVVQERDGTKYMAGQRVRITRGNGGDRIIPL